MDLHFFTTKNKLIPKTGIAIKNTIVSFALIENVKNNAVISMTGERTIGRIPLDTAVCNMVTSLVKRVIKLDVEK